jgi:hypothetical protein
MNLKYFVDFKKNAVFSNEQCDICGSNDNCLEAEYFDNDEDFRSICLKCLLSGKQLVNIPSYLKNKLIENIKQVDKRISDKIINEKVENILDELSKTPPVPWVQFNNWPVYNGDFMKYIGEWNKEDFIKNSSDKNGKNYILSLLDEQIKKQIDDMDAFWDDIGENTIVFVFESIDKSKRQAIVQSY